MSYGLNGRVIPDSIPREFADVSELENNSSYEKVGTSLLIPTGTCVRLGKVKLMLRERGARCTKCAAANFDTLCCITACDSVNGRWEVTDEPVVVHN